MTPNGLPSWCQEPDRLDERQLGLLVESAASVLGDIDRESADEVIGLPTGALTAELKSALASEGVQADDSRVRELIMSQQADRELALAFVRQICTIPALCAEVNAAYEDRTRMLVVDPVTILAVSVLVLVIKLRHVRVGRDGVEVKLDPIKGGMLDSVRQLLGA
jgi:hypothetical protein